MLTGVVLAAVAVMFLLSPPRGKNKYYPLGFGIVLAALSAAYAAVNGEWYYYLVAAIAAAKGLWDYSRWRR